MITASSERTRARLVERACIRAELMRLMALRARLRAPADRPVRPHPQTNRRS